MIPLKQNSKLAEEHFQEISSPLSQRIKNVLKRKSFRHKNNTIGLSSNMQRYLSGLLNDKVIRQLITAPPEKLVRIIARMKKEYPKTIKTGANDNLLLENIFVNSVYEPKLNKEDFITAIGVDSCPYCNRNYIYVIENPMGVKPQIDHFFPKTKYPFLALSFYNLIPSCQTCNGFDAKGETDPVTSKLTNPYLIKNKDFLFDFTIKNASLLNPLSNKDSINVKINTTHTGNLNVFKLAKLYSRHSDHVAELYVKAALKYSGQYRNYLKSYTGINLSDVEIDRMILGNYADPDHVHKRPFAKLYQDIGRKLNLIK